MEKANLLDKVTERVAQMQEAGQLDLPKDYSAVNALRGAWLMLQDQTTKVAGSDVPVLEYCTPNSISSALFKMILDGLTPMKSQGAFIAYGNILKWQREYPGNLALAKRSAGILDAMAQVIWEGDVFRFGVTSSGNNYIIDHQSSFEHIGGKIKGAYAVLIRTPFTDHVEIMSFDQIQKAWSMAKGGITKAHTQFPDQMAKKTVLNRALKLFVNSSNDDAVLEDMKEEKPLQVLDHLTSQVAKNLEEETIGHPIDEPLEVETPIFEQMETDPEW